MDHLSRALSHPKIYVIAYYHFIFPISLLTRLPWLLNLGLLLPTPQFEHSPLQDPSKSIRLLRHTSHLAFELIEKSFDEIENSRIEYIALSYTSFWTSNGQFAEI